MQIGLRVVTMKVPEGVNLKNRGTIKRVRLFNWPNRGLKRDWGRLVTVYGRKHIVQLTLELRGY